MVSMTVLISFLLIITACNQQPKTAQSTESEDISVIYFHINARCVTCRTIETEARKDVMELFGELVEFKSYNLDEKMGQDMVNGINL